MIPTTDNNAEEARSLQAVDRRACGTGDYRETRRWVVEWWQDEWKMWCHESLLHESKEDGEEWLREATENRPQALARLVEVVERRTIVQTSPACSSIDSSTATAAGGQAS